MLLDRLDGYYQPMLAVLVQVQILSLLHPQRALVWPDGAQTPVEAKADTWYAREGFAIQVPGLPRRAYRGRLHVEAGLKLTNEVELEDYVASVVGSELAEGPKAAQQALAIAARTYALKLQERHDPLCDTTHCQFYRGRNAEIRTLTDGQVLMDGESLALPQYAASCRRKGCLSQTGASRLATKGADVHQILAHYYPSWRASSLISPSDSR
jgi:peptidoglycan hydrolase-like amidase